MSGRFVVILLTALVFVLLTVLVFALLPQRAVATHECMVGSTPISCSDITPTHTPFCGYPHYHGTLNGVPAPDDECGWGPAFHLSHVDEEDDTCTVDCDPCAVGCELLDLDPVFELGPDGGPSFYSVYCNYDGPPDTGFGEVFGAGGVDVIFGDGFESGDTSPWSASFPSTISGSGAAAEGFSMTRRLAPAPDANGRSPAEEDEELSFCDRIVAFFTDRPDPKDWVDAGVQAVTGGFSPLVVADATDIVVEASASIKANMDNEAQWVEAGFEIPHRKPFKSTPGPTLHQRFWGPLAHVIFYFWDG